MIWITLYSLAAFATFAYGLWRDWSWDRNRSMFVITLGDILTHALKAICWPLLLLANSLTIFDRILCIRLWTRK